MKTEKSEFKREEVKFITFQISASEVKPTEEKITAIIEALEPGNRKQLEVYLGLINFYDKFYYGVGSRNRGSHSGIRKNY